MLTKEPLKQILASTRNVWDHAGTRPAVRENFRRMLDCRTAVLGAEVYASDNEEKIVYHTCKSRACPSCGHRATLLWQRAQWAALPDIPYAGICFTMPNVLWPLFQQNRHLLHDLPALGAAVIQQWAKAKYAVRVLLMVVPHTFGGHLNFNSHLHILVSAAGLSEMEGRWVAPLRFEKKKLMHMWRYAVITYLREAFKVGVLTSDLGSEEIRRGLERQYERWWSIDIDHFQSKSHFLRYAGRYVRRPPVAQHRFVEVTEREVELWTKDKRQKRGVRIRFSNEEFVAALAEHVPDHYRHAIRHFGLLAPRTKRHTWPAMFTLLGQKRRRPPQRLNWANSLKQHFAVDPLLDSTGQRMHWVRRLKPVRQ